MIKRHEIIHEIRSLIENCPLSEWVKSTSLQIFQKLAEAEARIHNCSLRRRCIFMKSGGLMPSLILSERHWALITWQSKASLPRRSLWERICYLQPWQTSRAGTGHPGYSERGSGLWHRYPHELVTPTGAAIIVTLAEGFGPMPDMSHDRCRVWGRDSANLRPDPNLLRIITG